MEPSFIIVYDLVKRIALLKMAFDKAEDVGCRADTSKVLFWHSISASTRL